jgi:transcriptional regulator with XRE-family HTH domain
LLGAKDGEIDATNPLDFVCRKFRQVRGAGGPFVHIRFHCGKCHILITWVPHDRETWIRRLRRRDSSQGHRNVNQQSNALSSDNVGGRLRLARAEKGWTQEELAGRARTTQAAIQKIENGRSHRPRCLERLAQALSVSPAWLMFGGARAGLNAEAVEVARAWSVLEEPQRSIVRKLLIQKS